MFGEWMDNIEHLDAYVTDKPTDMEIDGRGIDYVDENPLVLILREEGTCQESLAIIKATIELKNWAREVAAQPMEDSTMKIKTVEPITLIKKIKTIEPVILAKNIISFPIEFVCDNSPINFVSIESAENFFPYNMISDSAYSLALKFFFFF